MTLDRDLERLLDGWLAAGPTSAPDRVLDVVTVRIDGQRQRPAWRLLFRRLPTMSLPIRYVALAGALLAALVLGGLLLTAGGHPPSAVPLPSPFAFTPGGGTLAQGTYVAELDAGRLQFTLPSGWSSWAGSATNFTLHRDSGPSGDVVAVFTDMRRPMKDAACTESPDPSVPPTTDALIADLTVDHDLQVIDTIPITVGGAEGLAIDVVLARNATRTCPFSNGQLTVPLVVDTIDGTGPYWGIGPNEKIRLIALQAPNRHNLVVAIDAAAASSFDELVNATMPIVRTFAFEAAAQKPEELAEGSLAAGDWIARAMPGDPLAFTVTVPDGGWTGFGGWAISPPGGAAAPSGSGLAFLHGPPVAGTPCGPDASQPATRSVEDVVARLSAYPGGQLSGLTDTTLAGYPGKRLDLQLPASLPCQHPYVFGEPQGIWAQGPSNHWRVWVLDVQGSPAVIVLMDYPGTSASDLAVAQAIVDSVRISPSSPRPASPSSAP